ncbi:MAG: hypothetical protein SV760_08080 [Halobacteria archaeon]|nr:hypothetical protein [Halobacteria archaeon]
MPSLAEVYERSVGEAENYERLYLGLGILALGTLMLIAGGVIGVSMPVASLFGADNATEQWDLGGVLAGIGIPLALIGIFTVLPTSKENNRVAAAGIGLGFLGVLSFVYAYPHMWYSDPVDLTWLVFLIYGTGIIVDLWALFRSVLDIEVSLPRNSISLEYVNEDGEVEEVSLEDVRTRDGSAETGSGVGGVGASFDVGGADAEVMDGNKGGGRKERDLDDAEVTRSEGGERDGGVAGNGFSGDRYCGNCAFYDYVRDGDGSAPYCRFHDRVLEDLEACEEYEVRVGKVGEGDDGAEHEHGTTRS